VDEMPLMYQQNTLQMEWCLNCHRNPAVNLRPTSEIYNMAWAGPSSDKPVWCTSTVKGGATAQNVSCTTVDPTKGGLEVAALQTAATGQTASDVPASTLPVPASYTKFTNQMDLGKYLTAQYHIRTPNELSSCETCHR
jgi:D-alanyl-D-alanine carboxypeptidase